MSKLNNITNLDDEFEKEAQKQAGLSLDDEFEKEALAQARVSVPEKPSQIEKDIRADAGKGPLGLGFGYWGSSKPTTDADIEEIAKKTGADPDYLKYLAPYLGAQDPSKDISLGDFAKQAGFTLANAAALGLPRKILTEKGDTPENIKGLEMLRELAEARRGGVMKGSEILSTFGGTAGKTVGKAAGAVLTKNAAEQASKEAFKQAVREGAVIGAAGGLGSSKSGDELQGTLMGAGLGAALPFAVSGVVKGASKVGNALTSKVARNLEKEGVNLTETSEKALREIEAKPSEQILEDAIVGGKTSLRDMDDKSVELFLKEQQGADSFDDLFNKEVEGSEKYLKDLSKAESTNLERKKKLGDLEFESQDLASRQKDLERLPRDTDVSVEKESLLDRLKAAEDNLKSGTDLNKSLKEIAKDLEKDKDLSLKSLDDEFNQVTKDTKVNWETDPDLSKFYQDRKDAILIQYNKELKDIKDFQTRPDTSSLDNLKSALKRLEENQSESIKNNRALEDIRGKKFQVDEGLAKFKEGYTEEPLPLFQSPIKEEVDSVLSKRTKDFEEYLTGQRSKTLRESQAKIDDYLQRNYGELGPAKLSKYKEFLKDKATTNAIDEHNLRSGDASGVLWKLLTGAGGSQWPHQIIDEMAGTRVRKTFNELAKAGQKQGRVKQLFDIRAAELFGDTLPRLSDDEMRAVYKAMDTGDVSLISRDPKLKSVYDGMTKYFEEVRNAANGGEIPGIATNLKGLGVKPLGIPSLGKNYVPHVVVNGAELERRIQDKINKVLNGRESLRELDEQGIKLAEEAANNPDVADLINTVKMYREEPVTKFAQLDNALKDVMEKKGTIPLTAKAKAALERNEGIPEYLLQTDLRKLASGYTNNLLSTLFQRESIEKLMKDAKYLRRLGMESGADYIEKQIQDVRGLRADSLAGDLANTTNKFQSSMDYRAMQAGYNTPKGLAYRIASSSPGITDSMTKSLYGVALGGLKLKSAITNILANFSTLAPEIGGTYGYKELIKAFPSAIRNKEALLRRAKDMGLVGADQNKAIRDAFASGIEASGAFRGAKYLADKATEWGMILFQQSEELNRALVIQVSDQIADNILKGDLRGLNRAAGSVKKDIGKILGNENLSDFDKQSQISDYLATVWNSSTQFIYDKASMAALGRWLGPRFAMFTKWPTETAGQILYLMQTKTLKMDQKALRIMERFVVPWLMFEAGDAMFRYGFDLDKSDRYNKIVGKGGLGDAAQISSLKGLVGANSSDLFTNPLVSSAKKIVNTAVNSNSETRLENTMKAIGREGLNYTPGSIGGYYRLFMDDIPTYVSGKRPPKE